MTNDLLTQLQRYGEVIDDAVPAFNGAEIGDGDSLPVGQLEPPSPSPRWRIPAVAGAAFAAVIVLGAIYWAIARTADEPGPADQPEPPTTVEVPSGERAEAEIDPLLGVPFEPVVPFVATIKVDDEVIEGDDIVIVGPLLEVAHGGIVIDAESKRRFVGIRIDVVEGELGDEPVPATGSYLTVTDGGGGTFLVDRNLFVRWEDGSFDAGELAWRSWSEYCALGSIEVGDSIVILNRTAVHVTCTRALGTSEVWVDTDTGIVLRARGLGPRRLIGQELGAYPSDFSIVAIDFASAPANAQFAPVAPQGSATLQAASRLRWMLDANPDRSVESLVEHVRQLTEHPLVGEAAPVLAGPTLNGSQFDIADHRGGPVVVLWWASWCQPGIERLEVVNAAAEELGSVALFAVAWQDEPDLARAHLAAGGITIPILDGSAIDPEPGLAWAIDGCPVTFYLDESGTILARLAPYDTVDDLLAQLRAIDPAS